MAPWSRILLYALLSLLPSLGLHAQPTSFEDFGNVTGEEIDFEKCTFDLGAHAVMLRRDAHVFPSDQNMITQVRIRIKILDDMGFDAASVKIPYYSYGGYEKIADLTASTYNFSANGDREVVKVQGKDIFFRPIDKYYSEVVFAMPGVRKGSIIEYAYTSIRGSYKMVDYWYLQQEIPVVHSHFDYIVLPNSEFSYRVLKSPEFDIRVGKDNARGMISFDMNDLPGLREEPYMDSRRDNLQRVELQMNFAGVGLNQERYAATWAELNNLLARDDRLGLLLDHSIPGSEDLVAAAKAVPDPERRMAFLFRSVQSRMTWDHYVGIMAKDKLKVPWESKSGSLAEINLILVNLLRGSGIQAFPVLASDRDHGRVDKAQPFVQQFNKVIAYVPLNGRDHFLDASDHENSSSLVPIGLLNTTGFLIDRKASRFVTIADRDKEAKELVNSSGRIGSDAVLTGEAFLSSTAYSRVEKSAGIMAGQGGYIRKELEGPVPGFLVDTFSVENLSNDSLPLNQMMRFRYALPVTGEYCQFPLALLGGWTSNPFTREQRFSDINFGFRYTRIVNHAVEISPELEVQEVPASTKLVMPDTSLTFIRHVLWDKEAHLLTVRVQFQCRRSVFSRDDYPMVREFYKKMYGLIQEPLVMRKRTHP